MNDELTIDRGSFRDPSGHVFEFNGRIIRAVFETGRASYEAVRDIGVIATLAAERRLVRSDELSREAWPDQLQGASYVLEHDRVPFISYPYEWCFGQLKAAALHHLDLQLSAFDQGVVLSDASAYNVQFIGGRPVFIDTLSLRPYREGEFWHGHRQFCEQFLNPLLLRSLFGVPHNAWFRGRIEGIPTAELARFLSARHYFSPKLLLHVALQAKLESKAVSEPDRAIQKARSARKLSAAGYRGLLAQLRSWISRLEPADTGKTVWGAYASANTYSDEETEVKKRAIRDFASSIRPKSPSRNS